MFKLFPYQKQFLKALKEEMKISIEIKEGAGKTKDLKLKKSKKANNIRVSRDYLEHRIAWAKALGFETPKYVQFCQIMHNQGYTCHLYEARQTPSKYVTVSHGGKSFKVRFSNHKPIHTRELRGDCDFFVGITNLGVRNTAQAALAAIKFFRACK